MSHAVADPVTEILAPARATPVFAQHGTEYEYRVVDDDGRPLVVTLSRVHEKDETISAEVRVTRDGHELHTIAHSALQAAILEGLVQRNVAKLVVGKPHAPAGHQAALTHCWAANEAKTFLTTAKGGRAPAGGLLFLALDSGARKGELCG